MTTCYYCGEEATAGHLTCFAHAREEKHLRAELHSARRGGVVARGRPVTGKVTEELVRTRTGCGVVNSHMTLVCGRELDHDGYHVSGRLRWSGTERPRQMGDDELAALGPVAPQEDSERLAGLIQVLLTARAQMLGLGEGLKQALLSMPRSVDQHAVRGLIGALARIVAHLDSFKIAPGETDLHEKSRLGADRLTAGEFDRDRQAVIVMDSERRPRATARERAYEPDALIDEMSRKIDQGERRIMELEAAPPVPEPCIGLVLAYRKDRSRAGRELSPVERAVLVSAVRGLWNGPRFGGDWVDRTVESLTEAEVHGAARELGALGYFLPGGGVSLDGVRLAVIAMDGKREGAGS